MPFIKTTTNIDLPKEKAESIKAKYGQAIKLLGKTEDWLMLEFEGNKIMYFKGDSSSPIAYVEVKAYGSVNGSNEMTSEITKILSEELGINPSKIYITYQEINDWGFNGTNF